MDGGGWRWVVMGGGMVYSNPLFFTISLKRIELFVLFLKT